MKSRRGLTLIEVILAVAILGVSMGALLTAASRCLAIIRAARQYQEAQWALGMGLAEYPLEFKDDIEELNVDPTELDNGFMFSRTVDEKDENDKDGLYVVRTRVTWQDRDNSPYEEIVQYVLYPKDLE